ncbi:diacylglycerol/lipid kinase family protein [Microbacterium sp.]|uniref:diacylglycerol/lipid kinase family protein n=1 Tax=Microbacterium sp. TaxID=51671 RepID=UPI003A8BB368
MDESPPRPHRAAVVYNPVKADGPALRRLVRAESERNGWDPPDFFETTVDDLGDGVARQALAGRPDAVLVAGGDGTVRAVSEAMAGTGIPLTIIPSGTGNLLARNLRLPLESPGPMVRATFAGRTRDIDVGFAKLTRADGDTEERAFVVMGGMGLDAQMIANTSGKMKKRVGWVAYVDGAAKSLVGARPFPIIFQLPGQRMLRAQIHSVVFANCGSLPAGLELIPEASFTDGQLDIAVFQPKTPLGWLLVWRRVAWDNSVLRRFRAGRRILRLRTRDNTVRYARGAGIDVAAQGPHPVQLDGDAFGEATHLRVRVAPGALRVALPAEAAS